ncbi:MAG TPA: diguanylate cyclase [Rectinemataceae bacterium]|nr:diguanylate cyclase [Rectinemataceae bacterium]
MKRTARSVHELPEVDYRRRLRDAELFSSFDDAAIDELASRCGLYPYEAGSRVFERGDGGDALFVVVEGSVSIGDPGSPLIAELVAGDTFGELELLSGRPRNEAATAGRDSLLLRFPVRGTLFPEIIEASPELSARILESCLVAVARRIRQANALVKENSPWVSELRRQAHSDKLTGLYNQSFLQERLGELCSGPSRRFALLMLKPDNFKEINDSYGHEAGDAVLRLLAAALARSLGPGDEAVRFQGNELAAVLPGRDRGSARAEAERLAALLRGLDLGEAIGDARLRLGVSFGAALCPEHGTRAESLIEAVRGLPLVGRERGGDAILFPEDAR